jgi:peptide deformylase
VPEAQGRIWLIDPVLVEADGSELGREGCLSLPEVTANVRRAARVVVRARDLDGGERLIRAEGFEARAILHEMDHLDGVLILDRVASLLLDVFPRRASAAAPRH